MSGVNLRPAPLYAVQLVPMAVEELLVACDNGDVASATQQLADGAKADVSVGVRFACEIRYNPYSLTLKLQQVAVSCGACALHIAAKPLNKDKASAAHHSILTKLLETDCNPNVKDHVGLVMYACKL